MDVAALRDLLSEQARFHRESIDAQVQANTQNLAQFQLQLSQQQALMAEMVKGLQGDIQAATAQRNAVKDKEGLTTKRAFSLLPNYTGKAEDFGSWKFQVTQFLGEDPYFVRFLEWIENDLPGEDEHAQAVQEMDDAHAHEVSRLVDTAASPPTPVEAQDIAAARKRYPRIAWYNQQLYQVLALNCKGDALAMIKGLATSDNENEVRRGVTAWYRLTRDQKGTSAQRILGLVSRIFQPTRAPKMSDTPAYIELWESRIREYERLVEKTEGLKTAVPDSCKVFLIRSLDPKDLEKDLLKLHAASKFNATKEYVLEQARIRKEAHFEDPAAAKSKPTPMEVDALLAKVEALKGEHREQPEEAPTADQWSGTGGDGVGSSSGGDGEAAGMQQSRTLEQIEAELLALKGGKGGKAKGKGKGQFPGNCHHCGKYGHRQSECWQKDQEMKGKGGKSKGASQKGDGKKGPPWGWNDKGWQDPWAGWSNKGGGKSAGKGGMYWFDAPSCNGGTWNQGPGQWQTVGDSWTPKLFMVEPEPPGLELRNKFQQLDDEEEVDFPLMSLELDEDVNEGNVLETSNYLKTSNCQENGTSREEGEEILCLPCQEDPAPTGYEFKMDFAQETCEEDIWEEKKRVQEAFRKRQEEKDGMRGRRGRWRKMKKPEEVSEKQLEEATVRVDELCDQGMKDLLLSPLIRGGDEDESPGLNAVSDTSRWLSSCPQSGYVLVKSVLDSGATDSCAPDCMCPEVASTPSAGSIRGQKYTAAGGKKIPNEGEKNLQMVTSENDVVTTNWQTVDITRPLSSVRQICMQGNRVIFGASGGVIYNIESGKVTPFEVEDNVYVLKLWLPPSGQANSAQGFGRQG